MIEGWVLTVLNGVLALTGLSLLLAAVRALMGPSLPDRVIALDLLVVISVAIAALLSALHEQPALLDVALVLAVIAFIATIAFAWFLERRGDG